MAEKRQNDFTRKLIDLRESKNWSKTEAARRLGLSSMQRYANYEYGTNEPDSNMLKRIANMYGVTTDYLLGKDSTPAWATKQDTVDLKEFLEANAGSMTFGGVDLTPEQDAQVRVAMATIFWNQKKKEKK
ncbi:helix-turn-helix domain-containing protein [Levilactobacillus yiduensis]|uniref:helix-turn-helix domain-containing protein n=1 Tax=Levilactobacillus yiduensis TaxID=2953880 RepID=UPI0021571CE4|nr:helix-turn-helix transcriptional regulator [Levilactobacillus yiduensis]